MQTQQDLINLIGLKISDDRLIWITLEKMLRSIPINEVNYALFAKAIDENLALYNRLMQLKVNRECYWLD